MEKRKPWHFWVIFAVLLLTVYNVLPTIFFYAKPLDKAVGAKTAHQVAEQAATRVNAMEGDAVSWIGAYAKNLGVKPSAITPVEGSPNLVAVTLPDEAAAQKFQRYLPRAGALIPFAPAQLGLGPKLADSASNQVIVERQVATQFPKEELGQYFTFSEKRTADGEIAPLYRTVTYDRVVEVGQTVGGESESALLLRAASDPRINMPADVTLGLAQQIVEYDKVFGIESPLTKRFYASFTRTDAAQKAVLVPTLVKELRKVEEQLNREIARIEKDTTVGMGQNLAILKRQQATADQAVSIIEANRGLFEAGGAPLTEAAILKALASTEREAVQSIPLQSPFFSNLQLDWQEEKIELILHDDLQGMKAGLQAEKMDQLLVNAVANFGRASGESIRPDATNFAIELSDLTGSHSFLTLNLPAIAAQRAADVENRLEMAWQPEHSDLSRANYPIWDYKAYKGLSTEAKQLGLLVYAPAMEEGAPPQGFRTSSLYVVARGMAPIAEKEGREGGKFEEDFTALRELLAQEGFLGYTGAQFGFAPDFGDDVIFELEGYYNHLLAATREKFGVHGTKRFAVLEFTNEKQRLLATNAIETQMHEELLKWRDDYQSARVDTRPGARYDVPPPTSNVLVNNLALSFRKYFRGDERKTLNWGLDLSGGKSVTIGLFDQANRPVTEAADVRQGINELQNRVNKMGVSEVEIRQEGDNIVLNFPGAQGLSASELVKASTMTFHIVNEKFSRQNGALASSVDRFLQEVWNEAVVTGRQTPDAINEIAYQHLGGIDEEDGGIARPRSAAAEVLYDAGLRMAAPEYFAPSSAFNDELSSVSLWRGDDSAEWQGQTNPLMIVFANYALEGANLEGVHAEYDPTKGNVLVFGVKSSAIGSDQLKTNPRNDFHAWTSQFAEDRIAGTVNEEYSSGRGWRMAVILNGSVISAPSLNNALRDNAQVSGHFSQREVNQLVADLKAGSLTFTPKILSEKNVSPDLGFSERMQGIIAGIVGLCLVLGGMAWYYRFAGLVAGVAVVVNLLIIWAVLQNLDAALTLPGIAGIILTIGMSVDANVLVFERIREEFAISKRIATAIQAGYKKAFSAIIDSNITTILAAFILLHFDAGPIRGFAVTLIIGTISSMFTALFLTRYLFAGWVQNPKHRELKMVNLFKNTNFNFLSKAKVVAATVMTIIVVGMALLFMQRNTIFGMDFTGGYALNVSLQEEAGLDYRGETIAALVEAGAPSGDVQVRQLNRPYQLRVQLGSGLEQPGRPFYDLPQEVAGGIYAYQANPRIDWVVSALEAQGLELNPDSLSTLQNQWNAISGQFSDTMRNSAIWGLGLALLCILVYVTMRFEFKYAVSAIVALAHDLLITVGVMAILHRLGVGVQIDLQVIGALMTIIGYSLNDTIVIFDRIREDSRVLRKLSFADMVNSAINSTLSRTLITSGTTLLVLIALVSFGGSAVFDFALVMTMGVVFGTFSSIFIASPVLLYFHRREVEREAQAGAARGV